MADTAASADVRQVADRIREAVRAGDPELMKAVFHPDAEIWENTTRTWVTLAQVMGFHAGLAAALPSLTFEDVRVTPTPLGYVDQHVKRFVTPDGSIFLAPSCLVVQLEDGLLRRAEEYLDSAQKPTGTDPTRS